MVCPCAAAVRIINAAAQDGTDLRGGRAVDAGRRGRHPEQHRGDEREAGREHPEHHLPGESHPADQGAEHHHQEDE
jgi:hypothetical protein